MRISPMFFALALCTALPMVGHAGSVETLTITTASGSHPFQVEVMKTEPEMEKGLMFRKSMPENHGMLFDFKKPQPVMMWMKNTYLPLDMVFIGADGAVVNVAANTTPMSEAIIPSGAPTLGVLEVNAGVAAKIGLKTGDHVAASIFPK